MHACVTGFVLAYPCIHEFQSWRQTTEVQKHWPILFSWMMPPFAIQMTSERSGSTAVLLPAAHMAQLLCIYTNLTDLANAVITYIVNCGWCYKLRGTEVESGCPNPALIVVRKLSYKSFPGNLEFSVIK